MRSHGAYIPSYPLKIRKLTFFYTQSILSPDCANKLVIIGWNIANMAFVKPVNGNSSRHFPQLSHYSVDNRGEDPVHCQCSEREKLLCQRIPNKLR